MTTLELTKDRTLSPIKDILQELKIALRKRYGNKLRKMMLFGSYARGDYGSSSDIDIAMILDDFPHACAEIERTGDIVSELSLKFDTLISLVPIKEKDWEKKKTALISNIERDGMTI